MDDPATAVRYSSKNNKEMDKRWVFKEQPTPDLIEKLSSSINTNPYLTSILLQRGIADFESARKYFRPSLDHLHDPFLMTDMDKAVKRLKAALDHEEKILIYGDYDVDGTVTAGQAETAAGEAY